MFSQIATFCINTVSRKKTLDEKERCCYEVERSSGFKFDSNPLWGGEAPMCCSKPWVREVISPWSPAPGEVEEVGEESPSLFFVLGSLWSFLQCKIKMLKVKHKGVAWLAIKCTDQTRTSKLVVESKISSVCFNQKFSEFTLLRKKNSRLLSTRETCPKMADWETVWNLLELHAAVLEPDFDLPFCQAQWMGDFYSSSSG